MTDRQWVHFTSSLATIVISKAARPFGSGGNWAVRPRWQSVVGTLMLSVLAMGCADGGGSAGLASSTEHTSAAPSEDTEPPQNAAEVIETTNSTDCINDAAAANDEFIALSTQADINLTRSASPELIELLATSWADCLGTVGVSQLITAELLISGRPLPDETASCLTAKAMGDEADLMRHYFASVREEEPAEEVQAVATGLLASCVPGSLPWEGQLPFPFEPVEVQCLDDSYRSSPEFSAYFRAQSYGPPLTAEENAALAERAYECINIANQVLAPVGGDAGISDTTLECVERVARSDGYLQGGVTADNEAEFEDRVGACFTEDDIALVNER